MRNQLIQLPHFGGNETQVGTDHLRKTELQGQARAKRPGLMPSLVLSIGERAEEPSKGSLLIE